MAQALTLKQLTDKVSDLEEEIDSLRRELIELRKQTSIESPNPTTILSFSWTDKLAQKRWIDSLFAASQIQGVPIGAQELQKRWPNLT